MGGLAVLARAAGFKVTGCDANVYPPMSEQLAALGIELIEGYDADQMRLAPDIWVVGNVVKRGNPLIEAILDRGDRFVSGPQWLASEILFGRWVLAVAGTHGKTTTSAMLAWILEHAGKAPGFLIGGVPANFGVSARPGGAGPFVIEADEYDTAFFDKRSKFVHYRPWLAILNNLEYDHADIFANVGEIQRQFRQVHRARLIRDRHTGEIGGHIRKHKVRPSARERALQRLEHGVLAEIPLNERDARHAPQVEQVERDHLSAGRDAARHDLGPAAGRRAEFDDQHARAQQAVAFGDLLELEGRARAQPLRARAFHVRVGDVLLHPVFAANPAHPLNSVTGDR